PRVLHTVARLLHILRPLRLSPIRVLSRSSRSAHSPQAVPAQNIELNSALIVLLSRPSCLITQLYENFETTSPCYLFHLNIECYCPSAYGLAVWSSAPPISIR